MRPALRLAAIGIAAALLPQQAAAAPVRAAKPQRILSMNQCTDLLLLQLVPTSPTSGLTYLARDGSAALCPGATAGVPVNNGTTEDIIKFRPDLNLTGDFSLTVTRRHAHEVGASLIEVKSTRTFE